MPEVTQVQIDFIINEAKAKGQLESLRAEGEKLQDAFKQLGLSGPGTGGFASAEDAAAYQVFTQKIGETNEAADKLTATTRKLGRAAGETRGVFEVFEGYLTRIAFRMVAVEVVMGGVRAALGYIKEGLELSKEEAVFKNVVGDAEVGARVFADYSLAVGGSAKEAQELAQAHLELSRDTSKSDEEIEHETLVLKEVSQAFGSSLKEIAKIYGDVRESGKITFGELKTLHRDTGHTIDTEVAAWKELDDHINTLTEDIKYQKEVYAELNRADDQVIQAQDRAAEKAEQRRDREANAAEKAADREVDLAEKAADREVDVAQKAADRKADAARKAADREADDIQSIRDKARSKGQRIGLSGEEMRAQALGQREYTLAGVRGTPQEYLQEGERLQRQQRQDAEEAARQKREETEATAREQRQQTQESARYARQEAEQAKREAQQDARDDAREAQRQAKEQQADNRRETQRREVAAMEQAKEDARQQQQIEGRRAMGAIEAIPGIEAKAATVAPLGFRLDQESVTDLGSAYKNAMKDLEDSNRALVGIFQGT